LSSNRRKSHCSPCWDAAHRVLCVESLWSLWMSDEITARGVSLYCTWRHNIIQAKVWALREDEYCRHKALDQPAGVVSLSGRSGTEGQFNEYRAGPGTTYSRKLDTSTFMPLVLRNWIT